jgi:hypothetical protein
MPKRVHSSVVERAIAVEQSCGPVFEPRWALVIFIALSRGQAFFAKAGTFRCEVQSAVYLHILDMHSVRLSPVPGCMYAWESSCGYYAFVI